MEVEPGAELVDVVECVVVVVEECEVVVVVVLVVPKVTVLPPPPVLLDFQIEKVSANLNEPVREMGMRQ